MDCSTILHYHLHTDCRPEPHRDNHTPTDRRSQCSRRKSRRERRALCCQHFCSNQRVRDHEVRHAVPLQHKLSKLCPHQHRGNHSGISCHPHFCRHIQDCLSQRIARRSRNLRKCLPFQLLLSGFRPRIRQDKLCKVRECQGTRKHFEC